MKEFDPNNFDGILVPYRSLSKYKEQDTIIVLHPQEYKLARSGKDFSPPSGDDVLNRHVYGFCGKATISVSTLVPKGKMYILL